MSMSATTSKLDVYMGAGSNTVAYILRCSSYGALITKELRP